jgi:chaperonin GroEL
MKITKQLLFGTSARNKLLKGVNIVAEAVGTTLGPRGRNVAINDRFMTPIILHDGVSVARQINLKDQFEDMGAEILKTAAIRTNEIAGDGTTTATILAQAIISNAFEAIASGANPMLIKQQIETASKKVMEELKKLGKKIITDEEIAQVATISSTDPVIGKLVAETIKKVGKDGVITTEEGKKLETEVDYKQGMQINRGYLSPYFVTNPETVEAVIENPYILITDKKINNEFEIAPFLQKLIDNKIHDVVIFAGEVVEAGMAVLVINKMRGVINVVAMQAPSYGARRVDELEDIATLTGGTAILEDSGRTLESITIEELGRAEKVTVDRDKTIILNGNGDKKLIANKIKELQSQIKVATSQFDEDVKKQRLANLTGSIAVINVGGATEVEVKERKERVIDAVNATKAAIEEGVVAGGQMALLTISKMAFWRDVSDFGAGILQKALRMPFKRLIENTGLDYAEVWGKLATENYPVGIDVIDGEVKNLIDAGVIDPVKVERVALENAVSVATMLMTTEVMISEEEDEKEK